MKTTYAKVLLVDATYVHVERAMHACIFNNEQAIGGMIKAFKVHNSN